MHGGRLYAALGFLGIGIYNPATLTPPGAYNLYADCNNSAQEDWFGYPNRKPSCPGTIGDGGRRRRRRRRHDHLPAGR